MFLTTTSYELPNIHSVNKWPQQITRDRLQISLFDINPLTTNVPIIQTPVSWFDWFLYDGNIGR